MPSHMGEAFQTDAARESLQIVCSSWCSKLQGIASSAAETLTTTRHWQHVCLKICDDLDTDSDDHEPDPESIQLEVVVVVAALM